MGEVVEPVADKLAMVVVEDVLVDFFLFAACSIEYVCYLMKQIVNLDS